MSNNLSPIYQLTIALDKPILIVTVDGSHIYGILRSIDAFENIAVENCFERIFIDKYYTENDLGFQMIQGNNIAFVSQINGTLNNCPIEGMTKLSLEEFIEYTNLTEEEKLERNNGEVYNIATNSDYKVFLNIYHVC